MSVTPMKNNGSHGQMTLPQYRAQRADERQK